MFEEIKTLKDHEGSRLGGTYGADSKYVSFMGYSKTSKLITALYMVTDIIDKEEPIRNKLRTLGTGIISDIHTSPSNARNKISEIMSFLDVAFAINIISEMNYSILRKEFLALDQSISESKDKVKALNRQMSLSEFFAADETGDAPRQPFQIKGKQQSIGHSIGHIQPTRIGVQKGSTLMKALSDRASLLSDRMSGRASRGSEDPNLNILKKQRRDEIIAVIKNNFSAGDSALNGATITDIKSRAKGQLSSLGEKTLQRELVSMVKDNILAKTGSKRWSRYYLSK